MASKLEGISEASDGNEIIATGNNKTLFFNWRMVYNLFTPSSPLAALQLEESSSGKLLRSSWRDAARARITDNYWFWDAICEKKLVRK